MHGARLIDSHVMNTRLKRKILFKTLSQDRSSMKLMYFLDRTSLEIKFMQSTLNVNWVY